MDVFSYCIPYAPEHQHFRDDFKNRLSWDAQLFVIASMSYTLTMRGKRKNLEPFIKVKPYLTKQRLGYTYLCFQ